MYQSEVGKAMSIPLFLPIKKERCFFLQSLRKTLVELQKVKEHVHLMSRKGNHQVDTMIQEARPVIGDPT